MMYVMRISFVVSVTTAVPSSSCSGRRYQTQMQTGECGERIDRSSKYVRTNRVQKPLVAKSVESVLSEQRRAQL